MHPNHADKLAAAFGLTHLRGPAFAVIWTTTPWTLPANEAVSVHPELTYDLIETAKGALILARELAEACLKRYGLTRRGDRFLRAAPRSTRSCSAIRSRTATSPSSAARTSRLEAGTGLVHTAPAHGVDDYNIGKKYGLPVNNPVGDDGRFLGNTPALSVGELAGKTVWEANPLVLQELECRGRLLKTEKIQHSYPHCWRHKTPIIFRATHAVVHRHGAQEGRRTPRPCAGSPSAPSTKRSSSRPGAAPAWKR